MKTVALLLGLLLASPASAHLRYHVYVVTTAVTTTSATAVDVTGLSFAARNGVPVWFRCKMPVKSTSTSSRVRFDINGPASTLVSVAVESYATVTTKAFDALTALTTLTAIGDTPNTDSVTTMEGVLAPSAVGTYQVRFASETAGQTLTVEIGAVCEYSYEDLTP